MSPSDSDDYQSKFNLYERALKNAKYDIKGEIDSFDSSEKGVKEELKLILPEIINENIILCVSIFLVGHPICTCVSSSRIICLSIRNPDRHVSSPP